MISDVIASICNEVCDAHSCIPTIEKMSLFLRRAMGEVKTVEDRVQALFIIDATLQANLRADMDQVPNIVSHFAAEKGYEMLAGWFAHSCTYKSEMHKLFTGLVLKVLLRNTPKSGYARKSVVGNMKKMLPYVEGTENKNLLRHVIEKYKG